MKFYKRDGRYVATKAECDPAGGAWERVEIGTDQDSMLALLNAQQPAQGAEQHDDEALDIGPGKVRYATPPNVDDCPKCGRSERAAETLAKGDDIEALAAWIEKAEDWQIERLFAAIGYRLAGMRK